MENNGRCYWYKHTYFAFPIFLKRKKKRLACAVGYKSIKYTTNVLDESISVAKWKKSAFKRLQIVIIKRVKRNLKSRLLVLGKQMNATKNPKTRCDKVLHSSIGVVYKNIIENQTWYKKKNKNTLTENLAREAADFCIAYAMGWNGRISLESVFFFFFIKLPSGMVVACQDIGEVC